MGFNMWRVQACRDHVFAQGSVSEIGALLPDFLLQGIADSHDDPALNLGLNIGRVDGLTHIVGCYYAQDVNFSGLRVHLHLGQLGRIGIGRIGITLACFRINIFGRDVMPCGLYNLKPPVVALLRHLSKRDLLLRVLF